MMPRLTTALALALALSGVGSARGQMPPLTVPKGKLRIDLLGQFESYDRRWNDGTREEWAADFAHPSLDRTVLPALADAEARLKRITGLPDPSLSLGRSQATQLLNFGTMGLGVAVGLTSRVTVFGMAPLVRVRARTRFTVDTTGATAALNGADPLFGNPASQAQLTAFLGQLNSAIGALRTRLANGAYDADPALKALALSTVDHLTTLADELFALLGAEGTASAFAPRAGTPVANALVQVIRDVQGTLAGSLGVVGFTALPPLPSGPLSEAELLGYVTSPDGPIDALPLADVPTLQYLGDVELGAAVSLLDRLPVSSYGHGARAAVEARVRLPTGQLDDPRQFLDAGTGDRQMDIELTLVGDVTRGRFGARVSAGYNLQLAGAVARRIAPPGQFAPASTLANLRRNPGDVVRVSARPFVRLAPFLSLSAGVDYWRRGTDRYDYAADQSPIDGADLGLLALGSRADAMLLSGALTYTHSGLDHRGEQHLPLDASVRYQQVMSSTSGQVADLRSVRVEIRFYTGLF